MDYINSFVNEYPFIKDLNPHTIIYLRYDCDEFYVAEYNPSNPTCQMFQFNCGNFCGANTYYMCASELLKNGVVQCTSIFEFDIVQIIKLE